MGCYFYRSYMSYAHTICMIQIFGVGARGYSVREASGLRGAEPPSVHVRESPLFWDPKIFPATDVGLAPCICPWMRSYSFMHFHSTSTSKSGRRERDSWPCFEITSCRIAVTTRVRRLSCRDCAESDAYRCAMRLHASRLRVSKADFHLPHSS